jgi:hypothetical protein
MNFRLQGIVREKQLQKYHRMDNFNIMLFVDHHIKSEDDLQYSVYNVNKTAAEFFMKINAGKNGLKLRL